MAISLVSSVAPACARVSEKARHVRIHHDKIPVYAASIRQKYAFITDLNDNHYKGATEEETARYVMAIESINFGSGYFTKGLEYAVVARGLKRAFEAGEMNEPERWADVRPDFFAAFVPEENLPTLFAKHLSAAGRHIVSSYQGRVMNMIEAAGRSAPALADIVAHWDTFHDVHMYDGEAVPILKRAQILAGVMHLGIGGFSGMEKLTIFSDNMVPHVLRCDGLLSYTPELAAKIDGGIPLVSGSAEEVEVRAAAVHAVELMRNAIGDGVTAVNFDHVLWHRGHEPDFPRVFKRHITKCEWY